MEPAENTTHVSPLTLALKIDLTIQHFALPELLPDHQILALNPKRGIISLLASDEQTKRPLVLAEQQFSAKELHLLVPLLHAYPQICPSSVLLAHFLVAQPTEQYLESCRLRLVEAKYAGTWEDEMRPLRNRLSTTRVKLHACGIDIGSVVEVGYLLVEAKTREQRKEAER